MRMFPRFVACPVTVVSAKLPAPFAVSLKFVLRTLATPPPGNSRLDTQYDPDNVWFDAPAGAGIAINMSNTVGPASVDAPTSAPCPSRAFSVTLDFRGLFKV